MTTFVLGLVASQCGGEGFFEPSSLDAGKIATGGRVYLRDGWLLQDTARVTETGSSLSSGQFGATEWIPARVPGTVLTSLVEQGIYPEPLYGLNNLSIPESLNKTAYWYRTSFAVPPVQGDGALWLSFDGINHKAEVWLNGKSLGFIAGAFKRARYEVRSLVKTDGPNFLAVKILPPPNPGVPHEQDLETAGKNGGIHMADAPAFTATIGWDWIPGIRDRNMGIWQDVYLSATGPVSILYPQVKTDLPLPALDQASISISAEVANNTQTALDGTLQGEIESLVFSAPVHLGPGETKTVTFDPSSTPELLFRNPRLWWPLGFGKPELYRLKLTFLAGGKVSDEKSLRFGIREVSYVTGKPGPEHVRFAPRQGRYLRVNALKRASTVTYFGIRELEVYSPDHGAINLARGKAANASSARQPASNAVDGDLQTVWLSEKKEPQWLGVDLGAAYRIDRVTVDWNKDWGRVYTLQVSQDGILWEDVHSVSHSELQLFVNGKRIMPRGGNWGMDEAMKRNDRRRFAEQIRFHREANMNMIRNWVGMTDDEDFYDLCDENGIMVWDDFWLANDYDGPDPSDPAMFMDNARDKILRYRNHPSIVLWCARNESHAPDVLREGLDAAIRELDGTRRFQRSSADDGVHGRGPYRYAEPESYFSTHARGFSTEIGLPSIPSIESIREMMPASDVWPISRTWAYHDLTGNGKGYAEVLAARYGQASSAEDFARKGALINYENHRAIFEAWNSKMWEDTTGVLLWMSNPAQPSFMWQLYDYYLEPTSSLFAAKKGAEQVHIQLNLHDNRVMVVNHGFIPLAKMTAQAQIFGLDGRKKAEQATLLDLAESRATDAFALTLPDDLGEIYFVKLALTDASGRVVSDNFYWRSTKIKDFTKLATLPAVTLTTSAREKGVLDERQYDVSLENPTETVAIQIRIKLLRDRSGKRVLPVHFDDNYFWLLPGERKTIIVRCKERDLAGEKPRLIAEGLNLPGTDIPISR